MYTEGFVIRRFVSTIIDFIVMSFWAVILLEVIIQIPYNLLDAIFPGVLSRWPGLLWTHIILMDSKPEWVTLFHPFYYGPFYSFLIVSLPLFLLLIVRAPKSLGRKLMRLEVCYVNGSICSAGIIRLRESIKWLWLFPMLWLVFGSFLSNGVGLLKDHFASSIRFPLYYIYPFSVFMWVATLGGRSIHDIICGTSISPTPNQMTTGCSLLVATAFFIGLASLCVCFAGSYYLSILTWQNVGWDWDVQDERVRDMTGSGTFAYAGEPRFAFAMAVYSMGVFSWTYLVYRIRKRRGVRGRLETAQFPV